MAFINAAAFADTAGGTTGVSLSVTSGNLLIFCILGSGSGNTIQTPTSSPSTTWTAVAAQQDDDNVPAHIRMYYATAPSTATITVNADVTGPGGGYKDMILAQYDAVLGFDVGGGSVDSTLTLTPTYSSDLAVFFWGANSIGAGGFANGTGYTLDKSYTDISDMGLFSDTDAGSAGGSESFTSGPAGSYSVNNGGTHYVITGGLFRTTSASASGGSLLLLGVG